jgi:hypothetical protein
MKKTVWLVGHTVNLKVWLMSQQSTHQQLEEYFDFVDQTLSRSL